MTAAATARDTAASGPILCAYEDRVDHLIGVLLLALSLGEHDPDARLVVFSTSIDECAAAGLTQLPNVVVRTDVPDGQRGWNVKPTLLLRLLDEHPGRDVTWIDSDIVLCSSIGRLLATAPPGALIATEEWHWGITQGTRLRTSLWGMPVGRTLRYAVNSCVLRVSERHRELLARWMELLASPTYRAAQAADWSRRPVSMVGDQDVLGALLGSAEFADVELHLLLAGRDVAQCFQSDGYSAGQRVANVLRRRAPVLVHAQGRKPWVGSSRPAFLQLSPYCAVARRYADRLDGDTSWIEPDSRTAALWDRLVCGDPSLRGLPFALVRLPRRLASALVYRLARRRLDRRAEAANRRLLAGLSPGE